MIIGNGLIANSFRQLVGNNKDILLFASGVSNSKELLQSQFKREENLLIDSIKGNLKKTFVYISSCDISIDSMSIPYYRHKLNMEKIVQRISNKYYILRLPQVVGKTDNKNTLFSFLFNHINNNTTFDIWINAKRNLIDIDDVVKITNIILGEEKYKNSVINIASLQTYSILDIVNKIECIIERKIKYNKVNKGLSNNVDITIVSGIIASLGLEMNDKYLELLIIKYLPYYFKIDKKETHEK